MKTKLMLNNKLLILILFMAPLAGIGIDLYSSSMPIIVKLMHSNASLIKLTIPLYLIGYGVGQIIFGTLSDSFGRKKLLLSGLFFYSMSSICIVFVNHIDALLCLRIIQGIFVAAPGVIGKAMLTDSFKDKQLQSASTYWVLIWAIGPVIAPTIGSYITQLFGWYSNFIFLCWYGISLVIIYLICLPETIPTRRQFSLPASFKNYVEIVNHKAFIGGSICLGITYSILVVFNILGPFLLQNILGYSIITYGYIGLIMGVGFFLGTLLNRFLIKFFSGQKILITALILMLLLSIMMLLLNILLPLSIFTIAFPTFLIIFCSALITPNCYAICLKLFPNSAGSSSAIMGTFTMLSSAFFSSISSLLELPHESYLLALIYSILSLLCLIIFRLMLK